MEPLASSSTVSDAHDSLIAGGAIRTAASTLISGQDLARGAVVGRIAASGKLTLCNPSASDGSQVPTGIMVHSVDASAGDAACQQYVAGDFNEADVVWHANFTAVLKAKAFDGTPIQVVTAL